MAATDTPDARTTLGLPGGSVRALLTLLVLAVVIVQVYRGREIEPLWAETLMIVLAHYFSSRRFIHLTPEAIHQLQAEGRLETETHPLYLPRHTIRAIIVVAFVALAVYVYQAGRILEPSTLSVLGVVFAYLLGIVARGLTGWWRKGRPSQAIRGWEDAKAVLVLLALLLTAGAYLVDRPDLLPQQFRNVTLGLVLFYFGSR